jgi:glycosyltransferase involved in cell wall biosynthesis
MTRSGERIGKKGILILSPFFRPNTGGVETHLDDLCRYLDREGCRVFVITYQPLTSKIKGLHLEKNGNIEIHRVPWIGYNLFHKFEPYPIIQFFYLTPLLFLYTLLFLSTRREQVDAIHAHGFTAAFIGNVLGRTFRKRLVVSMHAIYNFGERPLLAEICKRILMPFDRIFCLAEESKKDLIKAGLSPEKMSIYVQWVDQEVFQPRDQWDCRRRLNLPNGFMVLFVGRLLEKKGVGVLLEVSRKVSDDIFFVFVGDGPMEAALEKASRTQKNILPVGKKSQEEIALYYGATDLVAVPSQYEEGFARVVLEALSSGRPVLASNTGCLPEMITPEVGFLIEPTIENIRQTVEYLHTHPEMVDRTSKNCRSYAVRHFSEKNAEDIVRSYGVGVP